MVAITRNDLEYLAQAYSRTEEGGKSAFEAKFLEAIAIFEGNRWSKEILEFVDRWHVRIANEKVICEALGAFERIGHFEDTKAKVTIRLLKLRMEISHNHKEGKDPKNKDFRGDPTLECLGRIEQKMRIELGRHTVDGKIEKLSDHGVQKPQGSLLSRMLRKKGIKKGALHSK
jgi:hypothetical protein